MAAAAGTIAAVAAGRQPLWLRRGRGGCSSWDDRRRGSWSAAPVAETGPQWLQQLGLSPLSHAVLTGRLEASRAERRSRRESSGSRAGAARGPGSAPVGTRSISRHIAAEGPGRARRGGQPAGVFVMVTILGSTTIYAPARRIKSAPLGRKADDVAGAAGESNDTSVFRAPI